MAQPNLPEPWLTAATQKGLRGSIRAIAVKTELSSETVRRLVRGIGESENDTVIRVAKALGKSPDVIREWSGRPELGLPFTLPARANQLSRDQRAAVLGVVAAFLGEPVPRVKGREGHAVGSPSIDPVWPPAGAPAIEFPSGLSRRLIESVATVVDEHGGRTNDLLTVVDIVWSRGVVDPSHDVITEIYLDAIRTRPTFPDDDAE